MCDPRSHFAALHLDLVGPINIVLFGSRVVQSSERLFCLSCTIKMVGARAAYADCDPGKSLRPRNPFPPRFQSAGLLPVARFDGIAGGKRGGKGFLRRKLF